MKRRLVGHDYTRRGIYLLTMAVEGRRPRQTPSGSHPEHGLLFEPGYNDLLLRNSEEYQRWKHYLRDNPRRLLMLSAWEHLNERIALTAHDCQQMNLMALELAGE